MGEASFNPVGILKFSGAHLGAAGATTSYLADNGALATALVLTAAQGYPAPGSGRILRNLRVRCPANPLAANMVATVYINGVASTLTATVTTGSTALFKDTTHTVVLAADDLIDLRLDSTAGTAVTATVIATIEVT
jgi:hypothetical protein